MDSIRRFADFGEDAALVRAMYTSYLFNLGLYISGFWMRSAEHIGMIIFDADNAFG